MPNLSNERSENIQTSGKNPVKNESSVLSIEATTDENTRSPEERNRIVLLAREYVEVGCRTYDKLARDALLTEPAILSTPNSQGFARDLSVHSERSSPVPPKAAPKRLTHFLCIPLVTPLSRPQLQKSLQAFRSDVRDDRTPENPNGIPEKAIRPLGTLHLTLGVMSLLTPQRIDGALTLLRSLDLPLLLLIPSAPPDSIASAKEPGPMAAAAPKPLSITLRGLQSMHSPSKTSILYSSPSDPDSRLYAFCSALRAVFSDFLVPDDRPLRLHATILNTVYVPGVRRRSGGPGSGHGKSKAKLTIDAREVLERYADVAWMEDVKVERVAICQMGARRGRDAEGLETGEEKYIVEEEIEMPGYIML